MRPSVLAPRAAASRSSRQDPRRQVGHSRARRRGSGHRRRGRGGPGRRQATRRSLRRVPVPDDRQSRRSDVQPAARHQPERSDRRLLRLRRDGPSQQGICAGGPSWSAELSERELARVDPDPGHRTERSRCHGRVLVEHEHRESDERQPCVRVLPRILHRRRLSDQQSCVPAGRPAARGQRPRRRGRVLQRRRRQHQRVLVQHPPQPVQRGHSRGSHQPHRRWDQQRGRHCRVRHRLDGRLVERAGRRDSCSGATVRRRS